MVSHLVFVICLQMGVLLTPSVFISALIVKKVAERVSLNPIKFFKTGIKLKRTNTGSEKTVFSQSQIVKEWYFL